MSCALSINNLHIASTNCNVETSSYLTIRLFMLPIARSDNTHWLKWQIVLTSFATNLGSIQGATKWMPHLWPKSSQRSTLVPKVGLDGEEKQQQHHILHTTDAWRCRGPLAQDLCYCWFVFPLSPHKIMRPMWPPMQGSILLGDWMCLIANATLTIMLTVFATIIVMHLHACKTNTPLQLNRLQQSTISW